MSIDDFWNATILEISDKIESHERNLKQKVEQFFALADAIGSRIAFLLDPEQSVLQPWDIYPEAFMPERELADSMRERHELEAYKAARKIHAANHNKRSGVV